MKKIITILGIICLSISCGEEWLDPEVKSFYTAENTLIDAEGMEGLLLSCRKNLRNITHEARWLQRAEYAATDISTFGTTEWSHNIEAVLTPESDYQAFRSYRIWETGYESIRDAHMIMERLPDAEITNEETRNKILAEAYWHRAFWHYYMTNTFGDIPWAGQEFREPKVDFYTYSRESILEKIKKDLEFAVQWLPEDVLPGKVNRAAGYYLLTKVYMTLGEYDKAINAASQVIDNGKYYLMTERFGQGRYSDNPRFNVVWDLFEKENYSAASNREKILVTQDKQGLEGNMNPGKTRYWTALWWWSPVRDPNGFNATTYNEDEICDTLGRGIGSYRPSNYFAYGLSSLPGDLRFSDENWFSMDEYVYNVKESDYYGKTIVPEAVGIDTIRCLYPWRYDKFFVPEPQRKATRDGGHTDWYIYRLAGLYLLRAEAYWFNGNNIAAADDINAVRRRANAPDIEPSEVDIGTIFDERARELIGEERRMMEMQRVSYMLAKEGMMGYTLNNLSQKNWWYDRVMEKNNFFREQIRYAGTVYDVGPHNWLMPIHQRAIDNNPEGHINQNLGYPGSEDNIEPKSEITPNESEKILREDL